MKKIVSEIKNDSKVLKVAEKYSDVVDGLSWEENSRVIKNMDHLVKYKFNELFKILVNSGKIVDGYISLDDVVAFNFDADVQELFIQYLAVVKKVVIDDSFDIYDKIDDSGSDSIKTYFEEIDNYPLLSVEEERKLGEQISRGVPGAYENLVNSNLRLVISIAKHYIGNNLSFPDLIQSGNLGLMKAAEKYDYSLGYKFSTYATWWIKQSISRALIYQGATIKLPVYLAESVKKYLGFVSDFEKLNGREPTNEELLANLDVSPDKLEMIKNCAVKKSVISLEMPVGEDGNSYLGEFIADENSISPEDNILRIDMENVVSSLFDILSEREKQIIELRFGFDGKGERTLEEIGKLFGVSRERIRQIESVALRKMRIVAREEKYSVYYTNSFSSMVSAGKKKTRI